jgi:ketosteroid isomerase-like protein
MDAALANLIAVEEIRQLKARYLRSVDQKSWDDLSDTLTPDAVADYGTHVYDDGLLLTGRDAILAFMREKLGPELITVHLAGPPEISVDGDTATGVWGFQDTVISTEYKVFIQGAAYYEDEYRREADGKWRIAHTGYTRTYEAMFSLDDLPSFRFTANRWAAPVDH